eukprot:gene26092-biopygen111662
MVPTPRRQSRSGTRGGHCAYPAASAPASAASAHSALIHTRSSFARSWGRVGRKDQGRKLCKRKAEAQVAT